jgi:HAD superfamily hydrolase (TIGR01509 family)
MIKAAVFDLDGLLVDSEPVWHSARAELFRDYGLEWTNADDAHTMGVSSADWAAYMAGRLGHRMSDEQVMEEVVSRIEATYRAKVPLMPGARDAVEALVGKYPLALASGSHPRLIRAALEGAGWTETFAVVVSCDEVARGKPAPDVYLEATHRLRVSPGDTVVFEDSTFGLQSAHAAGVKLIAVPSSHLPPPPDVLNGADRILASLTEFRPEMLRDL